MNNRQGAKKLYKAHKTWIAAGVAAVSLLSASALGGQSVSASTATDTATNPIAAIAQADLAKARALSNLGDTITNMENFAAANDVPSEGDFSDTIAQAVEIYQNAKNNKATTEEIQQATDNATTIFNTTKAQFAAQKQDALNANKVAVAKLGDTITNMENFAAANDVPSEGDFSDTIAQAVEIYQNAKNNKATTEEVQQATDNATIIFNTTKAQFAAKQQKSLANAKAANENTANVIGKLGDLITNMENFAAANDVPSEADFNQIIAQALETYQNAKDGKATTAEAQQTLDNATTIFNTTKAQFASEKQQALIAANIANRTAAKRPADANYATTDRTPHIKTSIAEETDANYATTDRTPQLHPAYASTDRTPHIKTPVTETTDANYATTDRTPHIKTSTSEETDANYATTSRTPHIKTSTSEETDTGYATTSRTPHIKTSTSEETDTNYATTDRTPHIKTSTSEETDTNYATTDRTPHIKTSTSEETDTNYATTDRTPHIKTSIAEETDANYATTDRTPHIKTSIAEETDTGYATTDRTPHIKTTTPAPKPEAAKPEATKTVKAVAVKADTAKVATPTAAKAATTTPAAAKAADAMPTTGDAVNEGAVVAGVTTALLALFGLAETRKRRA